MNNNNLLKIKINEKFKIVDKYTEWNFVNILLTIIDNCNEFTKISDNINLNLNILLNFMIKEYRNTKNQIMNLILYILLSDPKSSDIFYMKSLLKKNNSSKYSIKLFINRLYKIKQITIFTLLNRISKIIDHKGYMYTKIINKKIFIVINKYFVNIHPFFFNLNRFNKIYKKILQKIDHNIVLESLKKKDKDQKKSGTLKYINLINNTIYTVLPKIIFVKISTSDNHIISLDTNGDIYGWGSNCFGQLGIDNLQKGFTKATKINIDCNNKKIIDISLGYSNSSIITEDNKLYSCGCTQNGRIGIKKKNTQKEGINIRKFTKINIKYKIVKIQSGSMHQCSIDNNNKIYSWGSKYYIGSQWVYYDRYSPNIEILKGILIDKISIGEGGYHTLALSISGEVYGWGHNDALQLGYPLFNKTNQLGERIQSVPIKLKLFNNKYKVKDIICGWSCTYILDYTGNVYICGRNNECELGIKKYECIKTDNKYIYPLKKHKNIKNINNIYNFKESVFFVNFNKEVYSVGKINDITSKELSEPWKIKIIEQIKNPVDISYLNTIKQLYFIE